MVRLQGHCAFARPLRRWGRLERVSGIEPPSSAWKAVALPLSYTRKCQELWQISWSPSSSLAQQMATGSTFGLQSAGPGIAGYQWAQAQAYIKRFNGIRAEQGRIEARIGQLTLGPAWPFADYSFGADWDAHPPDHPGKQIADPLPGIGCQNIVLRLDLLPLYEKRDGPQRPPRSIIGSITTLTEGSA